MIEKPYLATQQINLRFAHKKSDKKLDGFSIIPTLTVFQAIMVKNLVRHSDQCRISGSQFPSSTLSFNQIKTIRNCEYRNAVLNIEIFGLYPSTKENNYIILNIEMYSKPSAHKFFKPNLVLKIFNPGLNTSNLDLGLKVKVHINSSN